MEQTTVREQPLDDLVAEFLTDLAHTDRSPHICHAYQIGNPVCP
jgi:hypothetical protein